MPSPTRKTRDGEAATRALGTDGSCFCRGRPLFGRAAFRSVKPHEKNPLGLIFHRSPHWCTLKLFPLWRNHPHLLVSASGDHCAADRLSITPPREPTPTPTPPIQTT